MQADDHRASVTVSRVLHAGYLLECGETSIAIDPIFEAPFSVNCHPFPAVRFDVAQIRQLRLAAVFITHHHDDHCSLESLDLLDRSTPIYLYCLFDALLEMIRALGFSEVHALSLDAPVAVGPFEVTARRALDADVDSLFDIRAAGLRILDVADAWIDPPTLRGLAEHAPWDLVLWPFQTLRELEVLTPSRAAPAPGAPPPEWLEQLVALDPRCVVASSCQFEMEPWSWYNRAFFPITYAQFLREVGALLPRSRVLRLDPGRGLRLSAQGVEAAAPLPWIEPLGPQDVDYVYEPPARPPATSEIARYFPPLSDAAAELVSDYCRVGLLERHRALDPPADPYFLRPRIWRLSVYDHAGTAAHHHYRVLGAGITSLTEPRAPLGWCTEVPAAKLYGALARGESLTSMYVRINDVVFDAAVEREVAEADVLDDPLLRCLFNGVFGAYPRAQLARLAARRRVGPDGRLAGPGPGA